jgi:decaprenylphospho-beta-D-ribofuranose 2-oxidase
VPGGDRGGPAGTAAKKLTGWGRTNPSVAEVAEPADPAELAPLLAAATRRGVITRGLGRSYDNAAQNAGGLVITTTRMNRIIEFDAGNGLVICEAGAASGRLP